MTWTYWCEICDKPIEDEDADDRHASSPWGDAHADCCPHCRLETPTIVRQWYSHESKKELSVEWSNGAVVRLPFIPQFVVVEMDNDQPIARFVTLPDSIDAGMELVNRYHNYVLLVRYGPLGFPKNPATPHYYIQHGRKP